ncbi:MAG: hypothetical protein WBA57_08885 [Elainellaceae cyanobacterium]
MIRVTTQAVTSMAIAIVTTVATTAFTSYLLERPWCVQIRADNNQRIIYGAHNCAAVKGHIHQKQTVRYQISVDKASTYWR